MNRRALAWIIVILLLLPFFFLILSGCSARPKIGANTDQQAIDPYETEPLETAPGDTVSVETIFGEYAVIDIYVGEDGVYCMMADVSVELFDGDPIGVVINDPTLLAFNVSSEHDNGVFLFDLNDGYDAIATLVEIQEALADEDNVDLAEKIQSVIDSFDRAGPLCRGST